MQAMTKMDQAQQHQRHLTKTSSQAGFTLIEIMVVIVISPYR